MKSPAKNAKIAKNADKFIKLLENYVKHESLEIELTLKNGRKVIIEKPRSLEKGAIVQHFEDGDAMRIPLGDIQKADVYAL